MRSVLHFLLCIIGLSAALPMSAANFTVGDFTYYTTGNNEVEVRCYGTDNGVAKIPSTVSYDGTTYTVTGILSFAPVNDELTHVTLPPTVRKIGSSAFSGCTKLTEISLPEGVQEIGSQAFFNCQSLEAINVDSSNTKYKSIKGVLYNNACDTLIAYPCGKAGDFSAPDGVCGLMPYAFSYCNKIGNVTFPSTLTAFSGADFAYSSVKTVKAPGIKAISYYTFAYCSQLTNVEFSSAVESIGQSAFAFCKLLKSIHIPDVKTIGPIAFPGCESLESIEISASNPNYTSIDGIVYNKEATILKIFPAGHIGTFSFPTTVTAIDAQAFFGSTKLTTLTIPDEVTAFGSSVFAYCSNLESLTLPSKLTSLTNNLISGCTKLKTLTIPASVRNTDSSAFSEATLDELTILGTDINLNFLKNLAPTTTVYVPRSILQNVKKAFTGPVFSFDEPFAITNLKNLICGFSFKVEKNPTYSGEPALLKNVWVSGVDGYINPDANGVYSIQDFSYGKNIDIAAFYTDIKGNEKGEVVFNFKRREKPELNLKKSRTQTSATIEDIEAPVDESVTSMVKGIVSNGTDYVFENKPIVFKNLKPNYDWKVTAYAIYNGNKIEESYYISTQSLGLTIKENHGPTAVNLTGSYTKGDAKIMREWFSGHADGNTISDHGLQPDQSYSYTYNVQTDAGYTFSKDIRVTTSKLELTTLAPRCVSSSCAIVAASTNITDMEDNVGFQWKKYDAPASLAPSEGKAAVYGGMLEGYIKNLQSTSYYNTRAYYKDASGTYYYSDWVTFDPSDFSFFEPTVHTYPVQTVTETRATLRGYALAGTDAIISQGFQYWIASDQAAARSRVQSGSMINTVTAFGQIMEATLDNLREGTEYRYRAYVETAEGTKYGEEQSFITEGVAGVYDLDAEIQAPEVTVVRYYDLSGRAYSEPQKGFNIVLYSDGSTKKAVFK